MLAAPVGLGVAEEAFRTGKFREAAAHYESLAREHPLQARALRYNYAQALWMQDSLEHASQLYNLLLPQTEDPALASRMLCHLGLQLVRQERLTQALARFRDALLQDPQNEIARFNYELLKRRLEENPPPPYTPPPPPPAQSATPSPPPPTEHLGLVLEDSILPTAQVEGMLQRLMNRPELYLQQLRKRSADAPRFSDRPDW
jgi:tetratricopeptide (TPR) repeat protein